jgi:SulP family sulfate permease
VPASSRLGGVTARLSGLRPRKEDLRGDLVAAVPGAISSVPDGMAASILAGVSPVHGLYASAFGPIGGGLTASSRLMVITTTSAAALAAGSALADVPDHDRPHALFLLTVLAGALMIVAGVLRLGRYTRFVPHSVMIGFLSGVAVNIVVGQVPDLVGAQVSGPFALAKFADLLRHLGRVDLPTTAAGVVALVALVGLARTRLGPYSSLVALIVPSAVVAVLGSTSVALVRDVGDIPRGLPAPYLPHLGDLSLSLITGALSVAALVLIQGAGVAESAPNPDGSRSDTNHDFVAQGVGNALAGVFRGQPVGGSVGQTALSVAAGARSRWAAIFAGVWMLVILVALSGIVGRVVMATLAAVLIVAAVGSLRTEAFFAILRTGRLSQVALISTFLATLLLPVATAVGLGVVVSLMMQLNQEAVDLRIVELVPDTGGFSERPSPHALPPGRVVLLDVYGSLFYAGARTLQSRLPDPGGVRRPVVVLRLRGRAMLGATAFAVLADYAERLHAADGRLYLSGVDPAVLEQLHRNRTVDTTDRVETFVATDRIGEASLAAYDAATAWLAAQPPA